MSLWCEYAWLPDGLARDVRIDMDGGRIVSVAPDSPRDGTVLNGLTVPGFANAHSHAFHRALRGRTHGGPGTFWTWRERMYTLASRLDPDSYYRLARGVYAEMVLAGYTSVGEFHYLHHGPRGVPYDDPNAMSHALVAAAADAGIRLSLLDTCYLAAGFGRQLDEHQLRFGDGDADAWAQRVDAFVPDSELALVGAAAHSVRAVPLEQLPVVARLADGKPLHVHLSEQRAENQDCLSRYGRTPTTVLAESGMLGDRTVAVHATHVTESDIGALGRTATRTCFCPTTERDLGDGIGPARALHDSGSPLCLGSDSHAVVDGFEEVRALEVDERLASEQRGRFGAGELLAAATDHSALGWGEVGALAPGAGADLVTVELGSVRTAGVDPASAVFAATAADVRHVMVAGRWVVADGTHTAIERPESVLTEEIGLLWA